MNIDITKNTMDKAKLFVAAFGKQAEAGHVRAVNRAIAGVRTDGVKAVRDEYNVKAGVVRKAFRIRRASRGKLDARAVVSGSRIGLIHFSPRPSRPGMRKPAVGLSVKVKSTRKVIPGAFVARMPKTGRVGIFKRSGAARLPLEEKYSLAVPEMVGRDDVREKLSAGAVRRYEKTLDQEINHIMQKAGRR